MELPKEDKQYLLTLSTVNVANFVPTKLWFSTTESNYKTWKEQMLCLFESQGLVDFVSRDPPTKKQEDVVWRRTDWLLKGWILGSTNDDIASTSLQKESTTSKELWLELDSKCCKLSSPELPKEDKQYLLTLSTINVTNFVPTKLWFSATKSNYKTWKEQMLCLLESQGLVDFVSKNPPTNNQEDVVWKRTDRLLKGWILGSINDDVASTLMQEKSNNSRQVWLELSNKSLRLSSPVVESLQQGEDLELKQKEWNAYLPLYRAILRGDWEAAKRDIRDDHQGSNLARNNTIMTALQVAVGTGKGTDLIAKLVELVHKDGLENLVDNYGTSVLGMAAAMGNKKAAGIIVGKVPVLLKTPNSFRNSPAHIAAQFSHKDMLQYLLSSSGIHNYEPEDGLRLLTYIIDAKFIDIALDLVETNPELATETLPDGTSALKKIAGKKSLFFYHRDFTLWDHIISYCNPVETMLTPQSTKSSSGDIERMPSADDHHRRGVFRNLHAKLWNYMEQLVPQIRRFKEKSLVKQRARKLVTSLCQKMESMSYVKAANIYFHAILTATELENHEVVDEIIEWFPAIIYRSTRKNPFMFQMAAQNRSVAIFKLICRFQTVEKHLYSNAILDSDGNNLLHLVGKLGPSEKFNEISGAALQMQYELQWFQAVENFVHPCCKYQRNNNGKTPEMVFAEEHKQLIEDGEKWMKETANSYTIAAALIATLMFAAAITVPGGNESGTGFPIFAKDMAFIVFAYADCASLFTSTISLLIFLSIFILRYAAEDFLHKLPRRLIYGLGFLFLSITFMMVAFTATVYLVFCQKKAWTLIPVATFASLPVISFVLLQSSLLTDLFVSAFGHGIFGEKSK